MLQNFRHRLTSTILFFVTLLFVACTGSTQQVAVQQNATPSATPATAQTTVKEVKDYNLQMFAEDGNLKAVKLSEAIGKGKVVVIDFWATWCGPCVQSIPDLVAAHNEYRNKGVEFFGLSIENPAEPNRRDPSKQNKEAVVAMAKDLKINYRVGFSPDEMFTSFDRSGSIPQTFIFGKDGKLVKHYRGFNPMVAPKMLREGIEKALQS